MSNIKLKTEQCHLRVWTGLTECMQTLMMHCMDPSNYHTLKFEYSSSQFEFPLTSDNTVLYLILFFNYTYFWFKTCTIVVKSKIIPQPSLKKQNNILNLLKCRRTKTYGISVHWKQQHIHGLPVHSSVCEGIEVPSGSEPSHRHLRDAHHFTSLKCSRCSCDLKLLRTGKNDRRYFDERALCRKTTSFYFSACKHCLSVCHMFSHHAQNNVLNIYTIYNYITIYQWSTIFHFKR